MSAGVESEIKVRMADPESARAAVRAIGAALVRARHFEDNLLLDDADRSLTARGSALRVRRVEDRGVLTFKGPRQVIDGVKSRQEIETGLDGPAAAESILLALGYRPAFRYQKYREVYRWKDAEIVVDETPIGTFLEIEGEIEAVHATASALGFGPDRYITESYVALYLAGGGQGDMIFR